MHTTTQPHSGPAQLTSRWHTLTIATFGKGRHRRGGENGEKVVLQVGPQAGAVAQGPLLGQIEKQGVRNPSTAPSFCLYGYTIYGYIDTSDVACLLR